MADMELLIKISEERYKEIVESDKPVIIYRSDVEKVLANGIKLPKGHGDLIDAKEVYKKFYCRCLAGAAKEVLDETLTIIEADNGGDIYAD